MSEREGIVMAVAFLVGVFAEKFDAARDRRRRQR